MYVVTEMFKRNTEVMVSYTEIESGHTSVIFYDLLVRGIKNGLDKRNWFNVDSNGYNQGDISKLPGGGEFRNGTKYFVLGRGEKDNSFICYTKDGVVTKSKEQLAIDYKKGLLINANVSENKAVRLNRGTLKKLPSYNSIDSNELVKSIEILDKIMRKKSTGNLEFLFGKNGEPIKEWILPIQREYITEALGNRDIRNLCLNSTRLGGFIYNKMKKGDIDRNIGFRYVTASGPMLLVHKVICEDLAEVIMKFGEKDSDALKMNSFMIAYTSMLCRVIKALNYS